MKISVDDKFLFELNETQIKVIKNEIIDDVFEEDMKRRLQWVLMHKYEECFIQLQKEWHPKLEQRGIEMIPTNRDAFANLVFSQTDYKDKKQLIEEEKLEQLRLEEEKLEQLRLEAERQSQGLENGTNLKS